VSAGGDFDEDVGAGGEPECADASVFDVGAALEPGDGGVDVTVPGPAVGVWVALALAAAAGVVEEGAVAGVSEQRRVSAVAVAVAAVDDDDRGAVCARGRTNPTASRHRWCGS
jgi:hypothetical protein